MRVSARVSVVAFFLLFASVGSFEPALGQASAAAERRAVDRAQRLRVAGGPDEAMVALTEYLDGAPAAVDALRLLGDLATEAGSTTDFLAYAERAVSAAPEVAELRRLWVAALVGASQRDSAKAVAERWVEDDQGATARRSLADVHLAIGDSTAAISALQAVAVGRSPQLLAKLADLLLATGDLEPLRAVWLELLGLDPPRIDDVVEDLRGSGERQDELLAQLSQSVFGRTGSPGRAGSIMALRLGRAAAARRMAADARSVDDLEAAAFLREYVREADDVGLPAEVAWAALQLVQLSPRPADRMRWQAMAADRALAAGDTSAARDAFVDLRRDSEPGDGPYGLASRRLFSLLAADPTSLKEAGELLDRYARLYPDSGHVESDMRGELALGFARANQIEAGEAVLADGRRRLPASSIGAVEAAAARLSLFAGRADSAAARAKRSLTQDNLEASEGTRRLRLLTFVQTADSSEVRVIGAAAHGLLMNPQAFDPGAPLRELAGLPGGSGRATALAFLAEEAVGAHRPEIALGLQRQIVQAYPGSPEAPAALLALARVSTGQEAVVWLEQLIVGYPESALAPLARRMLTQIQREGL